MYFIVVPFAPTVLTLALYFFFFQAEDGIRDYKVTGVQTCALPISLPSPARSTSGNPLCGIRSVMPPLQPTGCRSLHRLGERASANPGPSIGRCAAARLCLQRLVLRRWRAAVCRARATAQTVRPAVKIGRAHV